MSSLQDILNTGSQALRVQQLAMQVIGQNTANVDTEGYTRRRLDLSVAPPWDGLNQWQLGGGVDVASLSRVRDQTIDDQIRRAGGGLGYWTQRDDTLGKVESIFSEMGDSALSNQLQQFWAGWQDLANNPEGMGSRTALLEKAQTLASGIRRAAGELASQQQTADKQVVSDVNTVNDITSRVAALNVQIVRSETSGQEASDLRDERDRQIDKLSKIIDINVSENSDGAVNIYNGGQVLVQVDRSVPLTMSQQSSSSGAVTTITYGESGQKLKVQGGELKAVLELRDGDIQSMMNSLDNFATSLANRVNEVHRSGYGLTGTNGIEFFASGITKAADFQVASEITDDPSRIASSNAANSPGNNLMALQMAGIQNEKIMNGGHSTLDDFYRDSVLTISSSKAYAADQLKVENAAMDNLNSQRQQVSGVSMDEEMTRLVQVQQAYQAAAKIVNTVDSMMQTVLALGSAA